jgi:hypothetical protein
MTRIALVVALLAVFVVAARAQDIAIHDWSAPKTWTPPATPGTKHTLIDVTNPLPFVGLRPCRLADTRGLAGFSGQAGGPILAGNTARDFVVAGTVPGLTTQCGVPSNAEGVSVNFTVTGMNTVGNLIAYPAGSAQPNTSVINWNASAVALGNGSVVPVGSGGAITVFPNVPAGGQTHLIIDVNGYFSRSAGNGETFQLFGNVGAATAMIFGSNADSTGYAIRGLAAGTAVVGQSTGSGLGFSGVNGNSVNAIGVFGASTNTNGMWAQSTNYDALAAFGGRDGGYFQAARHGLIGVSTGSGVTYGVIGSTAATGSCAAGVKGLSGAELPCQHFGYIGVYGNTQGAWGVLGVSTIRGVQGTRVDSSGVPQTGGVLGYTGTSGVNSFEDITASGTKSFVEPHPYDSTRQINFIAAEANEPLTMFRGRGRFQNGVANLAVPEEFQFVTEPDSLSIQITPIGDPASVAVTRIGLDGITVRSNRNVEFFYLVHGRRAGFEERRPIEANTIYVPGGPGDRMPNYPLHIQKRLVALGVYNQDGTVNMKTAETNGWAAQWRADAAAAEAANAAAAKRQ